MLIDRIKETMGERAYISTKELLVMGMSKSSISRLVSEGKLIRVSRGLYSIDDDFIDEMYVLHNRYKTAIFSHESALYLHGLTDRNPDIQVMTVGRNYKATPLKEYRVRFKYVDKAVLALGMEYKLSDMGNEIPVYDIERTICDIIKSDTKMDSYVVNTAIRQYVRKGKLSKLMIYASKMGIEKKVRKKLEVLI